MVEKNMFVRVFILFPSSSNYSMDKSVKLPHHSAKATFVKSEGSIGFYTPSGGPTGLVDVAENLLQV